MGAHRPLEEVGSQKETLGQPREPPPVPFLSGHFQSWGCTCNAPSLCEAASGKGVAAAPGGGEANGFHSWLGKMLAFFWLDLV